MSNENNKIVAKGQHGNKKYKITSEEFNFIDMFSGEQATVTTIRIKIKFLFFWITIWETIVQMINKDVEQYKSDLENATNQATDILRLLTE